MGQPLLPHREVTYDIAAGAWCARHRIPIAALRAGALSLWCTALQRTTVSGARLGEEDLALLQMAGRMLTSGEAPHPTRPGADYDQAAGDEARRVGLTADMLRDPRADLLLRCAQVPAQTPGALRELQDLLAPAAAPLPPVQRTAPPKISIPEARRRLSRARAASRG